MTAEHVQHGYKVSFAAAGVDESKELGLTLTSRQGLWTAPKVQNLCQVRLLRLRVQA